MLIIKKVNRSNDSILQDVRQVVDTIAEDCDPSYETAVIMVAAVFVGPNVEAIVGVTESSRELVESIASRMRASGIWTNEGVDYDDWFSDDDRRGISAIGLHLGIAQGIFIRTGQKNSSGEWIYECVPPPKHWQERGVMVCGTGNESCEGCNPHTPRNGTLGDRRDVGTRTSHHGQALTYSHRASTR